MVHAADIQDRDGGRELIKKIRFMLPRMKKLWADGGYAGKFEAFVKEWTRWEAEIVKRSDTAKGFKLLAHRWIVERTFGWLGRYRRLSKDYELFPQTGENIIYLAMINLMLHRLAPEDKSHNYLPRNQALAA